MLLKWIAYDNHEYALKQNLVTPHRKFVCRLVIGSVVCIQLKCIIIDHKILFISECWDLDPHKRPSFKDILLNLEDIQRSAFSKTPNESFHKLQDGWKKEINEVLQDLCKKEKVSTNHNYLGYF